ncbi:hypothetical protein H7Y21_02600 [Arenimonas sp.]|nr:hypothetical protein [Candidatus Parcubacteria bacterium]
MNTQKQPIALREVLPTVFAEFGDMETMVHTVQVSEGNHLSTSQCKILEPNAYGSHVLVYHEYLCSEGKDNMRKLEVYDETPNSSMFDEYSFNNSIDPILTLVFQAVQPLSDSGTPNTQWQKHKGLWIEETIITFFGGAHTSSFCTTMIGDMSQDRSFLLLVQILLRAYGLGNEVTVRGHWQREWDHEGKYLKRPSGKK